MKKNSFLLLFTLASCIFNCAFSQGQFIKMWDKRFGGTDPDILFCLNQSNDGGYIIGGCTHSGVSGNKTEPVWGSYDYWIVKVDSIGNKVWEKNFGGTSGDLLYSIQPTHDGGYILGGYSHSGITGNKTEANRDLSNATCDYWILKIDALGNRQWDKTFGGTQNDYLTYVEETSDHGFILGGFSDSGIGGDKTQASVGLDDYWIVKTDSLGNKQWDKNFGTTLSETLFSVRETADGGFIIGGFTDAGISGDKTQPTQGSFDFWIVKTDALGNKQWDKDFGGTDYDYLCSIQETPGRGFILGGYSASGIGGDKTQPLWGASSTDYWIIKTDSSGNKIWDKDIGGTSQEEFYSLLPTLDGGYLLSGDSYSPVSGNKSENNLGQEQTWIVKTDSNGTIQWDKTIFTPGHDEQGVAIQSRDGCYVIANCNNGGIGGYKTYDSWNNSEDYWIMKICDSSFIQANLTAVNNLCPGTCVDFSNLSFNATLYQWSFPGANPNTSTATNPTNICYTSPGYYDVQLIATNANGSDTLLLTNYVTVYPTPLPQGIIQSGDTLFANTGSATYQWFYDGNSISGATDYFFIADTSGNYSVVAADSNGCEVEAVINNVIANTNQLALGNWQLAVAPNPVTTTIDIRGLENNSVDEINIFNVLGDKVFSAVNCPLPIANCQLLSGIYYLEISSDKKIYRTKFLKQ